MVEQLTKEQIAEFKDAFSLFDGSGDGTIMTKDLGKLMRSLAQNPSEGKLQEMIHEVDADGSGTIGFTKFLGLMVKRVKENAIKDELVEAFKAFDTEAAGAILAAKVRIILTNLPQKLSAEEADEVILQADDNRDGQISYEDVVRVMFPD